MIVDNRAEFVNITGLNFSTLSTVDHPFVSFPVRLLDSHKILYDLNKNENIALLNWDVSQPNERVYRYDLQIDLAVMGRYKDYFFFQEGKPYATQESYAINYYDYERIFNITLELMAENNNISYKTAQNISNNYKQLKRLVIDTILEKDGRLVDNYTQKSMVGINRLLDRHHVADFINNKYIYYFGSALMTKWIPFCIETVSGARSIDLLIENKVFSRKIFRSLDEKLSDELINSIDFIKENKQKISFLISECKIIPSIEVLYWSLEAAGVNHFGNDYGFFANYSKYLKIQLFNQITDMYGDGKNYFEIDKDYGLIYNAEKKSISKKNTHSQVKNSRINSSYAIYLLLGDDMKSISDPKHKYGTVVSLDTD